MAEIHLFILWSRAEAARDAVLQRIGAEFEILRVFRIHWSASLFSRNLSRFYGQHLPPGCNKEGDCGTGPFILIVVRDDRPSYALRNTTRGAAHVNTRTFDIKSFFRFNDNGHLPIHATDTCRETSRDLTMLLGIGPDRFVELHPGLWNGKVQPLHQDITGAWGWENIESLFSVFNETLDYVVLRNFECLPGQYHMKSHGDIDLLVSDYAEACLIANSTPVFREPYRVHHTVLIAGEDIPFDFRYVGDNYYDKCWQQHILKSRIRTEAGFFVPDAENHFYSLLYHAAVHKPTIAADYAARLIELGKALGIQFGQNSFFGDSRKIRAFLLDYMNRSGYGFTRPLDISVYFNAAIGHSSIEWLAHRLFPQRAPGTSPATDACRMPIVGSPVECELRVLYGLRKCRDVSSFSPEVHALIYDTQSESLLSPVRANLLRPFRFSHQHQILEIGCGGGSITRFLGEAGVHVTALESDPIQAAITAERCRDLHNVTVHCDSLSNFRISQKFDYVILAAWPDCATSHIELKEQFSACLKLVSQLIKQGGSLILAGANKLGLKYFAGCHDDHMHISYFEINGLHSAKTLTTFGKQEITSLLNNNGFKFLEFLYPFPDHQLTHIILSQKGARARHLNHADLLVHTMSRNYPENYYRAFADNLAWGSIATNHLLEEMANSFLIHARMNADENSTPNWLAKIFSHSPRRQEFQVETTIEQDANGKLMVYKHPLTAASKKQNCAPYTFRHILTDGNYIQGRLLLRDIQIAITREDSLDEIASSFKPWLSYLYAHEAKEIDGARMLPGNFIDCIPANLIVSSTDNIIFIDAEWESKCNIPMPWVIVRGVVHSISGCLSSRTLAEITYRQLLDIVLDHSLSNDDYILADEMEQKLLEYSHLPTACRTSFASIADTKIVQFGRLSDAPDIERKYKTEVTQYKAEIMQHKANMERLKRTVSWRITIPLRVTWNLARKLFYLLLK